MTALPSRGKVTRTGEQSKLGRGCIVAFTAAGWLTIEALGFRIRRPVSHNVHRYCFSFVPAQSTLHKLLVSMPRFSAVAYLSEVL